MVDRTVESLRETVKYSGLDIESIVDRAETVSYADGAIAPIIEDKLYPWRKNATIHGRGMPDIVFLEGADFVAGDINIRITFLRS